MSLETGLRVQSGFDHFQTAPIEHRAQLFHCVPFANIGRIENRWWCGHRHQQPSARYEHSAQFIDRGSVIFDVFNNVTAQLNYSLHRRAEYW